MKDRSLDSAFILTTRSGTHARYANGDHIRLLKLGPIALFNKYRLTSSSGKEIEEIENAHVLCLMYKLISSSRDSDDLSVGFHTSIEARERELTINITTIGDYPVRIFLRDVFDSAEHQDNCTYGLDFKLTLQRCSDNHVFAHLTGANDASNLAMVGRFYRRYKAVCSTLYSKYIESKFKGTTLYLKLQWNFLMSKEHLMGKLWLLKIIGLLY